MNSNTHLQYMNVLWGRKPNRRSCTVIHVARLMKKKKRIYPRRMTMSAWVFHMMRLIRNRKCQNIDASYLRALAHFNREYPNG